MNDSEITIPITRYNINGDFGKVRLVPIPLYSPDIEVPFHFRHGGWHQCNDKYCIKRNGGEPDHIFLFSMSAGGVLQFHGESPMYLPANTVAWIPKGKKHSYYTQKGKIWELYWLHLADAPHLQLDQIFQGKAFLHISHMDKITREMEKLLSRKNLVGRAFPIETSRVSSNIYHIILQESWTQNNTYYKEDPLIASIIRDMDEDCARDWKLQELSEQYFISVPQLIRRFKAVTGYSPHAYLIAVRLQRVSEYLTFSNLSVEEISKKIGFPSTSNMITQFRKYYGMTPGAYRETKV